MRELPVAREPVFGAVPMMPPMGESWLAKNWTTALLVAAILVATISLLWFLYRRQHNKEDSRLAAIRDPEMKADANEYMRMSKAAKRLRVKMALEAAALEHVGGSAVEPMDDDEDLPTSHSGGRGRRRGGRHARDRPRPGDTDDDFEEI